jgi:hypothetical protein
VFISLGGGYRVAYACRLARLFRAAGCHEPIVLAGGFMRVRPLLLDGVQWIGPVPSLVPWLRDATLAVVAGGITLYEACAMGVPTLAVPVVDLQRRPVEAMVRLGAATSVDGAGNAPPEPARVVRRALELLGQTSRRRSLSRRGQAVVDGRGASRVARLLHRIACGEPIDRLVGPRSSAQGETKT